ncbi:MAG TPA: hypothetical protein VNB94_08250 [Mycobacteriales bacterium]|nr:hypothetical protein [Mycobacteriales bacterium]
MQHRHLAGVGLSFFRRTVSGLRCPVTTFSCEVPLKGMADQCLDVDVGAPNLCVPTVRFLIPSVRYAVALVSAPVASFSGRVAQLGSRSSLSLVPLSLVKPGSARARPLIRRTRGLERSVDFP